MTVRHLLTHTGGIRIGGFVFLDNQGKLTTTFPPGGTSLTNISTRRAFDTHRTSRQSTYSDVLTHPIRMS